MIESNWPIQNIIMIFDLIFTSNLYFLSFFGTKEIRFGSETIQIFHRDFFTDANPFYFIFVIFILFLVRFGE